MNRRSFMQVILAAGVAPAVVGSGILMRVRSLVLPFGYYTENRLGKVAEIMQVSMIAGNENATFKLGTDLLNYLLYKGSAIQWNAPMGTLADLNTLRASKGAMMTVVYRDLENGDVRCRTADGEDMSMYASPR